MLREIATAARDAVEYWLGQNPELHEYIQEDMTGACATASLSLYVFLKIKGFKPTLVQGDTHSGSAHCWVEVGDLIIDVTATQFGLPEVHVTKERTWAYTKPTVKWTGSMITTILDPHWISWSNNQAPNPLRVWTIVKTANNFLKESQQRADKALGGAQ